MASISSYKGKTDASLLVYRTGSLGDALVSMPAIQAIRLKFPNHRFVLLTNKRSGNGYVSSWDVLGPTGWFDEAFFYVPGEKAWSNVKNGFSLIRKLREISPEYVFNLPGPCRNRLQTYRDSLFFRYLAGSRYYESAPVCSAGWDNAEPEWKRLLRVAGKATASGFRLAIPASGKAEFQKFAASKQLPVDMEFLAIGPGSNMPAKKWAAERFAELGKRLLTDFPRLFLLVLGGKGDECLGDELCRFWGERSANLAGPLSIYGSAAALEQCAAYAGNDTGTMHLAAMAGKPCVAMFSARDNIGNWDPYGDGHVILRHDTKCAGCMLEKCEKYNNKCLASITVNEAFKAVKTILELS